MTRIDEFQKKRRNLKRFIDLAMRDSLNRTDEDDADLHELYRKRRSFLFEEPDLLAEWQVAEANYEQQFPNNCGTSEKQALLLGAEEADE
jgi:hypothetical protein